MAEKTPVEQLTYKQASQELELIIRSLESGDMELEGSGATPAVGSTRETSDAIIDRCVELLASGGIVAIKGLGGFHLACNAA